MAASPPSNLSSMHAYYGEEDKYRLKYLRMCRPVSDESPPAVRGHVLVLSTVKKHALTEHVFNSSRRRRSTRVLCRHEAHLPYEFRLWRESSEGERKQARWRCLWGDLPAVRVAVLRVQCDDVPGLSGCAQGWIVGDEQRGLNTWMGVA